MLKTKFGEDPSQIPGSNINQIMEQITYLLSLYFGYIPSS